MRNILSFFRFKVIENAFAFPACRRMVFRDALLWKKYMMPLKPFGGILFQHPLY